MKNFNLKIILPVFFLLGFGSSEIVSFVSGRALYNHFGRALYNHFVALIIGVLFLFVFSDTRYRVFLRFRAHILYLLGIGLLILTLLWGKEINFSRSWLDIRIITFQPSEIAKFTTILLLTHYVSKNYATRQSFKTIVGIGFISLLPFVLVFIQPDLGSSIVFLAISLAFLVLSQNTRPLLILFFVGFALFFSLIYFCFHCFSFKIPVLIFVLCGILFGVFEFIFKVKKPYIPSLFLFLSLNVIVFTGFGISKMLKPYQKNRIMNFINPQRDPLNSGYQISQSLITIGSGKLFGKGYLKGTQARLGFLPGKYTDFLFATICEEFGFVGAFLILIAYFILYMEILKISQRAVDREGSILCFLIFSVLSFQTILNIGMNLGVLPITGLPLPFVSYGGTAVVVYLSMIGVVLNVNRVAKE